MCIIFHEQTPSTSKFIFVVVVKVSVSMSKSYNNSSLIISEFSSYCMLPYKHHCLGSVQRFTICPSKIATLV